MIGSFFLGALMFWISDAMYSATLDVFIKILEGVSTLDPNNINPLLFSSKPSSVSLVNTTF